MHERRSARPPRRATTRTTDRAAGAVVGLIAVVVLVLATAMLASGLGSGDGEPEPTAATTEIAATGAEPSPADTGGEAAGGDGGGGVTLAVTPTEPAPAAPGESPTPTTVPPDPEPTRTAGPTREPTERPEPTPTPQAEEAGSEPTVRPDPPELEGDPGASVIVDSGPGDRREIALTFDAGDDRGYAGEILDVLAERGVVASFGVTGEWAEANPDLIERMVSEGHMVFNHTWSHDSFTGFSTGAGDPGTDYRLEELSRTEAEIADITGGYETAPYWRPPYGDLGPQTLRDAATAGYGITVMWTVDSLGWKPDATPEDVAARCLEGATPGGIMLLHVGAAVQDYAALPAILDGLEADGYELVTVEQILQP